MSNDISNSIDGMFQKYSPLHDSIRSITIIVILLPIILISIYDTTVNTCTISFYIIILVQYYA